MRHPCFRFMKCVGRVNAPEAIMINRVTDILKTWNIVPEGSVEVWAHVLAICGIILLAVIAHFIGRCVFLRLMKKLAKRTPGSWDDHLFEAGVFRWLVHLVPAIMIATMSRSLTSLWPTVSTGLYMVVDIYIVIIVVMLVFALLRGAENIIRTYPHLQRLPLRGLFQIVAVLVAMTGLIIIVSQLMGKPPVVLLSGLGAVTAVILLVFKDSLLGLTAGIQLAANRMIEVGDWIAMPKYGADGNVLDVALTTVKVQNWDKTITTIPTYALISDSFVNWRGMEQSGGRRVKRALYIDMATIRMADAEMVEKFRKFHLIKDYISEKEKEIEKWNLNHGVKPGDLIVNGRRITNVGTFRAYAKAYLRSHNMVNQEMTLLVRQLDPTDRGLPIELYFFSKDKRWANFEDIQSDVFDHLLAVAGEFGLRIFQTPSGGDLRELKIGK